MISTELWRARIGSYNNKRSRYSGFLSSLFSSSSYYYYHPRKRRNLSQERSDPIAADSVLPAAKSKTALTNIRAGCSFLMDSSSVKKRSLDTSEKASPECLTTTPVSSISSSSAGMSSSGSSSSSTTNIFSSFLFRSLFSLRHSLLREVLVILLIAIISQQLIISGDIETNPGPKRRADDKPDLSDLLYMSYTGDDGRDVHFRLMDQLKPHWRRLAIALKFPQHEIDTMESNDDPIYYLLKEWLRGANREKDSRPASWRTLIEALRHASVQEEATVLEKKLTLGLEAAYSHSVKEKYQQALQRGRVRVSYGRVMFLGPAAVGKTSLRHGLMDQPLPDKPDSTILAQTRTVKYSWVKIAGNDSDHLWMAEVTEEDELDEEAQLIVSAKEHSDMSSRSSTLHNRMDGPHHSLKAQSHEEVEKHTQQVLAKATQMQSQHTKRQEMWLHLWDCGGQPVFLDVLPAFLSSRTVFLLMFDASKIFDSSFKVSIFNEGKRKDNAVLEITTLSLLQKWIASIHARFGDTERQGMVPDYPRIILVGTHGDQLAPGRPVEEKKRVAAEILHQLNASFEGKEYADIVLGTGLVVDNTTAGKGALADSGFRDLHSEIFTLVEEKLSKETPVSWVHFRKVLQLRTKKKKPVIKLDEVYSIAAECHVPEGEVHSALLFYHELGVFLFYPNIKGLESVVILEPQWLVDRFGELFASWKGRVEYRDMWNTLTRYGVLVEPLYKSVLRSVHKHSLTPDALVKMLEHFLLAAPITTSRLHAKSGRVKEYFVPHMLQLYRSQSPHSAKPTSAQTHQDVQVMKAAPIHIAFLSGYVPPGYYVRLATSLASIEGIAVLFHTGIYHDQISMDIGVDRLTITEHNETIELQFSRQESIEEPFQKSCRKLLLLLNECFSEVCRWLPGANTQLAFSCSKCSQSPQPGVPSRAKLCPFTLEQCTNQHLRCQVGHKSLPSPCEKYWLQYKMDAIQQEQALFEEKIHLTKPVLPEFAVNLAKQLDVDPVRAVIHQYRRIGGDDDELIQVLSDMKLTTCSRPDISQPTSNASQLSTAALTQPTASQTWSQDAARMERFFSSTTETAHSSRRSVASSKAATQQLKPLNRPPKYLDLLNKVATRVRHKWEEIGLQLSIDRSYLKSIWSIKQDPVRCLADIFDVWQRNGSPPYTWATIIDALRAPIVGEVQLAHELEEWLTHSTTHQV